MLLLLLLAGGGCGGDSASPRCNPSKQKLSPVHQKEKKILLASAASQLLLFTCRDAADASYLQSLARVSPDSRFPRVGQDPGGVHGNHFQPGEVSFFLLHALVGKVIVAANSKKEKKIWLLLRLSCTN